MPDEESKVSKAFATIKHIAETSGVVGPPREYSAKFDGPARKKPNWQGTDDFALIINALRCSMDLSVGEAEELRGQVAGLLKGS